MHVNEVAHVRAVIAVTLRKKLPKEAGVVIDSFKEPYNVGDKSENGYWEITEVEDPYIEGKEEIEGEDEEPHVDRTEWFHGEGEIGDPGLPSPYVYRIDEDEHTALFIEGKLTGFALEWKAHGEPLEIATPALGSRYFLFIGPERAPTQIAMLT